MMTATKKATYIATFQDSIAGAVLVKVTRNRRRLDLADLPAGVIFYLCVKRSGSGAWIFDCDGHQTFDDLVACGEVTEKKQGRQPSPRQATATFTVDPELFDSIDPPEQLPRTWNDGAHCGLTDWYEPLEDAIKAALDRGKKYAWTTGWYGSKKEIASACITHRDGEITVRVSVSDDFDTEGNGDSTIRFTKNLERIRDAIDAAWEKAEGNQRDNRAYAGFSVGRGGAWEFTIIMPQGFGHDMGSPPGDCYHRWGWQEVEESEDYPPEIPVKVAEKLYQWAADPMSETGMKYTVNGWTVAARSAAVR